MKKHTKKIIAAITLLSILPMTMVPASAMKASPPTHFYGNYASGGSFQYEDGVVIENQTVTFDISEFPSYDDAERIKDYDTSVKTEYTLFNPTEQEITIRCTIPFYIPYGYPCGDIDFNREDYKIMINDKPADVELRYSRSTFYNSDNPDQFAREIQDEFISNDFHYPDKTVIKYTFVQSDVNQAEAYLSFYTKDLLSNSSCFDLGTKYNHHIDYSVKGSGRIYRRAVDNGATFDLYVFGDELKALPEWKIYESKEKDSKEIDGKVEFVSKETMTFSEFVFLNYDESLGVSRTDWFNIAFADVIDGLDGTGGYARLTTAGGKIHSAWTSGYTYKITLKPGERIVNTIITPIYPGVETKYEPPVYEYNYHLSYNNAKLFTGKINVNVNTPYYLIEGDGFETTENGSRMTMGPTEADLNELTAMRGGFKFILSEAENPEEIKKDYSGLAFLIILLLPIILIILAGEAIAKGIDNLKQWIRDIFKR